ncbi:ATP-binding protein [Rhodococcus rhodochrous]|uniref:ATP-binding protein n=1 Tax=Rhodococcus rhodochrous TaxID=1829 RepID=UPI001E5BDD94|nr:ATP-binding protein [Rhodococcus rhodochrous]MCB8912477.1 ATP-binding protein [Rhodococcus rhodochrous]
MTNSPSARVSHRSSGIFFHEVRAEPSEIAALRRLLRQWTITLGVGSEQEQAVVLATYEALANAVEHAYRPGDTSATIDLDAVHTPEENRLVVEVSDRGCWRRETTSGSRGHGLALIQKLVPHQATFALLTMSRSR